MAEGKAEKKQDSLVRIIQRKLKYQSLRAKIRAKNIKEDIKELVDDNMHKVKKGALTTVILGSSLTLSATGPNTPKDGDSNSVKTEVSVKAKQAVFNVSSEELADTMLANGQNTLENFDISNYKFSAEDLEMLSPGEQGKKFSQILLENAKGPGGKCLRAVKLGLVKMGINEQFGRYAYMAADVFRRNENFVTINCDVKDFFSLPNGVIIIRGKGNTPYGHAAGVVNRQDVSDRVRPLRADHKRWSSGKTYGGADVFGFTTIEAEKNLMVKFIEAGCLKQEVEQEMLASIAENNGNKGKYVLLTKHEENSKNIFSKVELVTPVAPSFASANYLKPVGVDTDKQSFESRKEGWRRQHAARGNSVRGG